MVLNPRFTCNNGVRNGPTHPARVAEMMSLPGSTKCLRPALDASNNQETRTFIILLIIILV
ncbi:unnamed protein product [Nezara viridula]|uniref:Uncharacterized protein n=1 Tax=Nezara viridula TaxID=85310 RepID=A0A9P0H6Y9_NEZVI|nr:unnamed protein product [Nezara viridula]